MLQVTIGRSQAALTQFRYPVLFIEGPRGTSKSRGILTTLVRRLIKYPGARLGLGRQFRSDLTKTILMTLEEEVFPAFGMPVPGGQNRENRSEYRLPNGSLILPFGIDQGIGALSLGLTFAYLAEVTERGMREESVTDIAGALRWMKSDERPLLPDYTQMILDGNPVSPAHWANKHAEAVPDSIRVIATREDYERLQDHNYAPAANPVHRWKRIITKHQDNPGYWDHNKWDYTPLGRNYVTQQLEGLTGFKRERWLNGKWKAADGAVYPEFDADKHVIPPREIPADWPSVFAKDPGRDHPDATIGAAISPVFVDIKREDGQTFRMYRIYLVVESVVRNTTTAQDAEALTKLCAPFKVVKKLGDPHYMFSRSKMSDSGRSIAQQMRDYGHIFEPAPAARNAAEMASQVELVRTYLTTIASDGLPMLLVFDTLPKTINGFQSWGYVRNSRGDMGGGEDKFEDIGDDEMDTVRMIVASNPKHHPDIVRSLGSGVQKMGRRYADDDDDE